MDNLKNSIYIFFINIFFPQYILNCNIPLNRLPTHFPQNIYLKLLYIIITMYTNQIYLCNVLYFCNCIRCSNCFIQKILLFGS